MPGPWEFVEGPAGPLAVHVAGGPPLAAGAPVGAVRTVVVCPGLPTEPGAADRTGRTFPALADRLASTSGWRAVAACLRGVGPSGGDFSLTGWHQDLQTLVALAVSGDTVWLAGFGLAGSLALCVAAADQRVRGVATMGAPASLSDWMAAPAAALAAARRLGVIRDPAFPPDLPSWAAAGTLDPTSAAEALGTRAMLVVHGVEDEVVPVAAARALAEAGRPGSDLRLLAGAGHRLRPDPRVVALLLGWLERQGP